MTDKARVSLQRGQRWRSGKTSGSCSLPQGSSTSSGTTWKSSRLRWSFKRTILWPSTVGGLTDLPDTFLRPNKTPRVEALVDLFGRCISLRFDGPLNFGDSYWIYSVRFKYLRNILETSLLMLILVFILSFLWVC